MISPEYKVLNEKLHESSPVYGSHGGKWVERIKAFQLDDVLDYGCGKANLSEGLGFPIQEYDPAIPGKDALPAPADLVVCTDVLEHIEPDKIDEVLLHLRALIKRVGFLVIARKPSKEFLADGRNTHLIVKPSDWWKEKLSRFFKVKDESPRRRHFVFIITVRRRPK